MNIWGRLTGPLFRANVRNYYFRKIKKGCECPDPKPDPVVEEKSCTACCFRSWKPKSKKCLVERLKEIQKKPPAPPKRCYAGMAKKPPPDFDPAALHPMAGKCCRKPKPPPIQKPPPEKKEKPLPAADWESSC